MKVKVYEMEMIFELTLGLKDIDEFMSNIGIHETLATKGTNVTIKQTIAFIPNEDYIHKVENVIKENYSKDKVYVITKLSNERQRKPSGLPELLNLPCFLF